MKTSKFSDCECGGIVSLVNEGSIKYPSLYIRCDTCRNTTGIFVTGKATSSGNKNADYKRCYDLVLKNWNTKGKFLNGLKYEYFLDVSYFDTWRVREKTQRSFNEGWNVLNRESAWTLCKILNNPDVYAISKKVDIADNKFVLLINDLLVFFLNEEELNDVYELLFKK